MGARAGMRDWRALAKWTGPAPADPARTRERCRTSALAPPENQERNASADLAPCYTDPAIRM